MSNMEFRMEGRGAQHMNLSNAQVHLKTESLDFRKGETVEAFGKTLPLDLPKTKTKKHFGQQLFGSKFVEEETKRLLLRLSRIRDFIRLLLTYPVRTTHETKLKLWTHQASNRKLGDLRHLLNEKPLKCFEGVLPMQILEDVEAGECSMLADENVIPEPILNLAANLAIDQMFQTVLCEEDHSRNIHHVLLSTRDGAEKRQVMKKIEAALNDDDNLIRLHETFLKVLCIDASVHQSQVEVHVQQQIAQQLQLPLMNEGDEAEGNDDWLRTSIKNEMSRKKYLVFLVDGDVEEPLDPRKVGFPEEELAGVVVFITTEFSKNANNELTMAMDLKIGTKDHLLPWKVFSKTSGNELVHSCNAIQKIAVGIVEECGSHLLAIAIVAKSLRTAKDVTTWKHALDRLRGLHPSYEMSLLHGQSKVMVNAFINFIWHDISETQKRCLERCFFIPRIKDGKLDNELINDWVSSQLVVAGKAERVLRELVDRFVLLQFKETKSRYIQMPEDAYAILQSLNIEDPLLIRKAELGLIEPPNNEPWQSAVHIFLDDNKVSELPLSPNCLQLRVLMLHNNADLTKIPPLFFGRMPLLYFLDLSCTSVRELPNSFFELQQLKRFYMKGCERFMKLPPEIGKLKKLEMLDLDKTQIIHMPKEVRELTNLQSLTLCFYEYRGKKSRPYTSPTIVPSGVISKLRLLKDLSLDVNPDDERWNENIRVIIPELNGLQNLHTISLYIPQPEFLRFIPVHILACDFRFIAGQHMSRIISGTPPTAEKEFKQSKCSLKFVKGFDVPFEIKIVTRHSNALFLDRHMTIKDLSEFGMMNLEELRVCILAECKEMKTIVDGRYSSSKDIFSRLLTLSVSYMKNLRSIWDGQVHSRHSFGMLKSLALHNCPKLTTVFTLDFLVNFSLLNVLIVKDCPNIRTLITRGPSELIATTFLPRLQTMSLFHLPELISISNGLHIGPYLENIGIYDCPKLQSLSIMELSSEYLKVIKGETKWWEALKWCEVEWGKASRPSQFDYIFSSFDNQVDIMTQLAVDDDIDNGLGGIVGKPLQPSSYKDCENKKQNANMRRKEGITTLVNEGSFNDGRSWGEYGQKIIMDAKYPRKYFRCTQDYDQGCQAIKFVDRIQEEPALYRTTYYGLHTCRSLLDQAINLGFGSPLDYCALFGIQYTLPTEQEYWSLIPSSFLQTKKECEEKEKIPSIYDFEFWTASW